MFLTDSKIFVNVNNLEILPLFTRFKQALQQNEIMDVFHDDWSLLGSGDSSFGSKADNHLKVRKQIYKLFSSYSFFFFGVTPECTPLLKDGLQALFVGNFTLKYIILIFKYFLGY